MILGAEMTGFVEGLVAKEKIIQADFKALGLEQLGQAKGVTYWIGKVGRSLSWRNPGFCFGNRKIEMSFHY